LGCGKEGDYICPACEKTLTRIAPPLCPRCGCPTPAGRLCPACAREPQALHIDGIRAPFHFEGLVREAVHRFKYQNLRALAEPLSGFLYRFLLENPVPFDVIVPVPIHPKKLRERGYNQSELLARKLGKLTGAPSVFNSLGRVKLAASQAGSTSVQERWQNVAGAFACRDERLKDQQVLLIDDVATSGATLTAAAEALKETGAASVWGLVLAREFLNYGGTN
jgi:ComF family protein